MPLNLINEYLMNRIKEFLSIMQESHNSSDGNLIMAIFALQRCSLLFRFDQFAGNSYADYKLSALRNFANWMTIQTPLFIIDIYELKEVTLYLTCILLWFIIIGLLIKGNIKLLFRNFFVFYQLLFVIPFLQILLFQLHEGDYTSGIMSLLGVIFCYIIYCFVHRNYLLPQKDYYIRRYSHFNFILCFADISLMVFKFYVNEIFQTILILALNLIFFIDSLLIQPYQYKINKKYISATSLMLLTSILKLLSFSITQDKFFYFILLISPLFTVVITQIYTKFIYSSFFNTTLNFERLLIIADVLSQHSCDSIIVNSIILNLLNNNKIVLETKNKSSKTQQIILSLLNLEIEAIKHCNDVTTIENANLYKILYLFLTCKRIQLGYIELKSFQCNSVKQSFYFNQVSQILQDQMGGKNAQNYYTDGLKQLSLQDIRLAELLYEENIQNIINILDTKIKFWLDLNKGYQKIEHLADNSILLSEKIWYLRDQFFAQFHLNPFKLQSQLVHFNSLELKLLAVLYSAILNDYHATLDIETRIEEILASERNQQTDKINNITLLNEELAIIATSFVKQPGLILNRNRGQLAKFFGFLDEIEFQNIGHIEQLMPTYIQQIHDKIISRYMKKGYSLMTEQSKEVYIKMNNNFIQAANISLLYMFEQDTDYIIHGVLQKVKQNQDFIIFDKLGKILGITEMIFTVLGEGLKLDQLLTKGFIYFWFHGIFDEICQLKAEEHESSEQFTKLVQKTQTIFPIQDFTKLFQEHDYTYVKSVAKHQTSEDFLLIETNDLERVNMFQSTLKSSHFFKEQSIQFMNDFVQKIRHLKIFDQTNPFTIKYSLQFHILGQDLLPVFIMQINEIEKQRNCATSHTTGGQSQGSLVMNSLQNDPFNEQQADIQILDEKSDPVNINPPIINKINNIQNQPDSRVEDIQQYQNCSIEQYNLISPRGNNKQNLINDDDEEYEEERIQRKENGKSSSHNDHKKKNIADILKENQREQNEHYVLDNAKQSQSSVTTDRTQISVFNILKKLQYSTQYQTTLKKVFLNTILLILLLTSLIIVQLIIARNNVNTLQSQIPLIRIPDKFNRLYCTYAVVGQMDLEKKLLGIDYGDYYVYRIKEEGNDLRPQMLSLIGSIRDQFSKYDQARKLQEAEITIINQYLYIVQNISLIQFSEMVNDYTQALNNLFPLNQEESLIEEQMKLIFLKGNLISLINLISNLVENIVTEFFENIDYYQLIYLVFLLIQLIIITVAIIIQFQFWVDPYIYNQNILLLICRIPEKEIEVLLSKYKTFKDFLVNEISKWKQTNYFSEFFTCRISQLRKIQRQKKQVIKKQKAANQRLTVNQRIQETQYSIVPIYIMLIFFWSILTSFVLSSYFFQSLNVQNSHPELSLCMEFVRFKQEFDSCMIISQFIKNQPLLSGYQKNSGIYDKNPEYNKSDGFFKTYTIDLIQQFQSSLAEGKQLYEDIYDNIVASKKISESNKNVLLGLYQDDLCDYIEDELPFCNYENGQFKYFPDYPEPLSINNNRERLRQGFNGIYQQILSLFSSKYSNELNGIEVINQDEIIQFLETPEYIQLLLPYFYDLNKAIVKFYVTIINSSVDILETDYQNYLAYYLTYGIVAMIIFLSVVILKMRKIQREVRAIRQALVLLPHESLLDIQVFTAIKRFEQQM